LASLAWRLQNVPQLSLVKREKNYGRRADPLTPLESSAAADLDNHTMGAVRKVKADSWDTTPQHTRPEKEAESIPAKFPSSLCSTPDLTLSPPGRGRGQGKRDSCDLVEDNHSRAIFKLPVPGFFLPGSPARILWQRWRSLSRLRKKGHRLESLCHQGLECSFLGLRLRFSGRAGYPGAITGLRSRWR
jgi:hypothetical protein